MVTRTEYKNWAVDSTGAIVASSAVEVRQKSDNSLATLYTAVSGAGTKSNPFNAEVDGSFTFFVEPDRYDLIVGTGPTQSTTPLDLVDARQNLTFETRAELVSWISGGGTAVDGSLARAGGYEYKASSGATDIADMAGWLPSGDVFPDHFAENSVPGTTDMSAAIVAAAAFDKTVYLRGVEYRFAFTGTDAITPQAGAHFKGAKGAKITFVPSSSSYRNMFNFSSDGLTVEGVDIAVSAPSGSTFAVFNMASDNLKVINCDIDGGVANSGVAPTTSGYCWSWPDTGTQEGLHVHGCTVHNFTRGTLKTNAATSTQRRLRFLDCDFYDCYVTPVTLNSPNGICDDVEVRGCQFYDTGTVDHTTLSGISAFLAFASVSNFIVHGNVFNAPAALDEVIHIEEECTDFVVTDNVVNCHVVAITVQDNNINTGATYIAPSGGLIQGNRVNKLGTAKAASSRGIRLTLDATGTPPIKTSLIDGNSVFGFEYGVVSDCEPGDAAVIQRNLVGNSTIGFFEAYSSQIQGNTTQDCDTDIHSSASGNIEDHTFIDTAILVTTASGPVSVVNPSFKWTQRAIGAGVTDYFNMAAVGANDRVYGILSYHCWDVATSNNHALETFEATWDGTTLTATAKTSLQPGAMSASPSVGSGNFRVGVFTTPASTFGVTAKLCGAIHFS